MKLPLILRIFKNGKLSEVKQFDQDQIVIGHNAEVHLNLDGDGVSPIHCLIEQRESEFYICDLGSQSGTFKNGQAILDEVVTTGDELQIGEFRIQFFIGVPRPKSVPTINESNGSAKVEPSKESVKAEVSSAPQTPTLHSVKPLVEESKKESVKPVEVKIPAEKIEVNEVTEVTAIDGMAISAASTSRPEIKTSKSEVISHRKKRRSNTFAPASEFSSIQQAVSPGKGPFVEILVCWKERVLSSTVVKTKQVVKLGSDESADLLLPTEFAPKGFSILDTTQDARIQINSDMKVSIQNQNGVLSEADLNKRLQASGYGQSVRLEQNEVVFVSSTACDIVLAFRFSPQSAVVAGEPPFMLSASELTALVLAIVMAGIFKFYIDSVTPVDWGVENEQVQRVAEVVFNPPPQKKPDMPKPPPEPVKPEQLPPPPPPKPPEEVKAQVADKKQENQKKGAQDKLEQAKKAQTAARASELAPKPNSKNQPKQFSSTRQGGAVKTTDKAGANAQSANKEIDKVGLFSTFGGGGNRAKLDQAYSGSGELLGGADKATGTSGFAEDRAGDDLGSKFKDTGAGGKGTATQGIAGIGTKGRGSGMSAYGSANGFGNKTTVSVESGGAEEDFVGTIDREAIRRVIRAKLHEVKSCYERALNSKPKGSKFEGKVILSWDIVARGQAKSVKVVSSTLGDSAVENCIRDRLASWVFPEPPEGMTAEVSAYPFILNQAN